MSVRDYIFVICNDQQDTSARELVEQLEINKPPQPNQKPIEPSRPLVTRKVDVGCEWLPNVERF